MSYVKITTDDNRSAVNTTEWAV